MKVKLSYLAIRDKRTNELLEAIPNEDLEKKNTFSICLSKKNYSDVEMFNVEDLKIYFSHKSEDIKTDVYRKYIEWGYIRFTLNIYSDYLELGFYNFKLEYVTVEVE